MSEKKWQHVSQGLPPEREVVQTKIDDSDGIRNEDALKFMSNLWWFPDGSMYVYYRPTHWRPL
jgi:hypothetical protein